MSSVRGCAGCATLFGRMYMLGGGTADSQFDTVEIFNPEINAWMPGEGCSDFCRQQASSVRFTSGLAATSPPS